MSTKRHIKIPYGLATALRWNTRGLKCAALFLVLKHLDTDGRGSIPASSKTYEAAAALIGRDERTVGNLLRSLELAGLIKRTKGEGKFLGRIELCSYERLCEYAECAQTNTARFHHLNAKKLNNNAPFEYILRLLEEKESQDRQRHAKRKKMMLYYQRLTLSSQEETQLEAIDLQALVTAFETGAETWASCDPDTARSHRTRAAGMCQMSHTGSYYWQHRLESLKLATIVRNRTIVSPPRKQLSRASRLGSVYYSRKSKSTVLQLPNAIIINP